MKNRKIIFWSLFLGIGLILNGCTKDQNPDGPEEPKTDLGEGLFSFRMKSIQEKMTKTTIGTDPVDLESEQAVDNVWMLLYDNEGGADQGKLKYAWNLDIHRGLEEDAVFEGEDVATWPSDEGDEEIYYRSGTSQFITKAKKVKRQNYKLVIIANPGYYQGIGLTRFNNGHYNTEWGSGWYAEWVPNEEDNGALNLDDLWYTTNGLKVANGGYELEKHEYGEVGDEYYSYSYEPLIERLHGEINNDMGSVPAYFFMSNANGLVTVIPENIYDTPQDAEDNPVRINIDRAVAKVIVNAGSEGSVFTTTGGQVSDLTWGLKNVNQQTYMYRQFAPLFDWNKEFDYPSYQGDMETETNSYRGEQYATDPNFEFNVNNNINKEGNPDRWKENFYSQSPAGYGFTYEFRSWNEHGQPEEKFAYATENTLDFESQKGANPMRGIPYYDDKCYKDYATIIMIRAIITYDRLDDADYYSYHFSDPETYEPVSKVFTHAQAIEWIQEGKVPADFGDLYIYLDPSEDNWNRSSFFADGDASSKPNSDLYTEIIDWAPVTHVIPDENGTLYFHPEGLNEYEIDIKHFNGSEEEGFGVGSSYGYLGVVRNNVYRIKINKIEGPGVPKQDNNYISANVTINPWYIREQEAEL